MTVLTVFANCQAGPMALMLRAFCPDLKVPKTPLVHQSLGENRAVVRAHIAEADIVLHQPVGAGYGDLATEALQAEFPDKTFVSFPSIFFGGLFPQLTYLRLSEDGSRPGTLKGPLSDYHDTRIIDAFLNGESAAQCLERLRATDLGERAAFDAALAESERRDRAVTVPVMDILQDEMQRTAPLFTFNHPTNRVLWRVLERVLAEIGRPVPEARDRLPEREFLGNTRAQVPDGIPAELGLPWRRPDYALWEDVQPMDRLIADFYALYRATEDFATICTINADRFALPVRLPA